MPTFLKRQGIFSPKNAFWSDYWFFRIAKVFLHFKKLNLLFITLKQILYEKVSVLFITHHAVYGICSSGHGQRS